MQIIYTEESRMKSTGFTGFFWACALPLESTVFGEHFDEQVGITSLPAEHAR